MVSRIALSAVALAALTYGLALQAQDSTPAKKSVDTASVKEKLSVQEQILARQYQEFEQQLLRLKQRYERSGKQEERDRALILDRVLEYCKEKSISVQFEQIVDVLKSNKLEDFGDVKNAISRSKGITQDLQKVVEMLREDTRSKLIREQIESMKESLEKLNEIIQNQKSVQGQTEYGKTKKDELAKNQESVKKDTEKIIAKLAKLDGTAAQETKSKGDPKSAGKNGDKAGKSKDDGEQEAKDGKDSKDGKSKDGGESQAKGGKGPDDGKDSKDGGKDAKDGKAPENAQAKDGGKDSKDGDKSQAKAGDPKKGDPAQAKGGDKADPKSGDPKSGSQAKDGGKSKKGDAKSGESSEGQSQAKDDKGSDSPPPSGQQAKGDNKKNGPQPPQQAKDTPPNGRKQVQDAKDNMEKAIEDIMKQKNEKATEEQAKALEKLEQARKKLEDLLRQLREEELERLLANLENRCQKMLAMQIQVFEGTKGIHKTVDGTPDKQPDRTAKQESLKQSDTEGEIVAEASKAIEILEEEGSAVAFPEAFQQVREDMKHVQRRLGITDVGPVTQQIESDIIDSLKEMIDALKKKQKELADNKSKPGPSGSPPPNQDQKLLEKIAELKMIRSLQIRVNQRTQTYGKMYQGEQAGEPAIRRELQNLSERQDRIYEITNRMAKGENR